MARVITYVVWGPQPESERLVDAPSAAAAKAFACKDVCRARVASKEDLKRLLGKGKRIEQAAAE